DYYCQVWFTLSKYVLF
nr:immunoglobulin light chain junction region [Macaca mulatta]